jgi:hypothetical protein
METPSFGNIQSETPPSPGRAEDQQFARFLEVANQLGDHLDTIFTAEFTKILANASLTPHPVVQMKLARPWLKVTTHSERTSTDQAKNGRLRWEKKRNILRLLLWEWNRH